MCYTNSDDLNFGYKNKSYLDYDFSYFVSAAFSQLIVSISLGNCNVNCVAKIWRWRAYSSYAEYMLYKIRLQWNNLARNHIHTFSNTLLLLWQAHKNFTISLVSVRRFSKKLFQFLLSFSSISKNCNGNWSVSFTKKKN